MNEITTSTGQSAATASTEIQLVAAHRVRTTAGQLQPGDVIAAGPATSKRLVIVDADGADGWVDLAFLTYPLDAGDRDGIDPDDLTVPTATPVTVVGFDAGFEEPTVIAPPAGMRAPRPRAEHRARAVDADGETFWVRAARLERGDGVFADTPEGRRMLEVTDVDETQVDETGTVTITAKVLDDDREQVGTVRFAADGDDLTLVHTIEVGGEACALEAGDAEREATVRRPRFRPGYDVEPRTRILSAKLRERGDGTAEVAFTGETLGMPWVADGRIFSEVDRSVARVTTYTLALVPTGKRVPARGVRIGESYRRHAYLIDTTVEAVDPEGA